MSTKLTRKRVLAAVAAVSAVAIAAVAIAYWTTSGSGSGSASTGNVVGVTVNQDSTVSGLYPGGPAQNLSGDFNNPNAGSVFITSVAAVVQNGWSAQADNSKPACTAADFQINGSPASVGSQVPSGNDQGAWSGISIQLLNSNANQDNCKGVSVPLTLSAS